MPKARIVGIWKIHHYFLQIVVLAAYYTNFTVCCGIQLPALSSTIFEPGGDSVRQSEKLFGAAMNKMSPEDP